MKKSRMPLTVAPTRAHRPEVRTAVAVERRLSGQEGDRPATTESRFLGLQRTIGNHAVRQLLQRDEPGPDKPPPSKTLYMGMNLPAKSEAKTLKGVLKDDVILAMNDPELEKSLQTDAGIANYLVTRMPTLLTNIFQFLYAYEAIRSTDPVARDQMAQVIKMFHAAESGEFRLERMVLSGHSNGVELWGDAEKNFNPGKFILDDALSQLTTTFPKAAAQVEDVMFSACYTVSSIDLVVRVFPEVKTVWGYAGLSPAAGQGSERHIAKWEKETRGGGTLEEREGLGKSALWTRESGYVRNDPAKANMKELRSSFYGLSLDAKEQYKGEKPINQEMLNRAYYYVQMMLAHPDVTEDERGILNSWMEVLLRLRHHGKICGKFAEKYAEQIKNAYAAIKRAPPNFAGMSRPALKAEKEALEAVLASSPNPDMQAFFDNVYLPFWKLAPDFVDSTWI